ncbi:hypothetical protein EYR40_011114 [Pleurotus pulmonarius]|nr:hypothetical protein EYR36_002884 [Pleurotus pulmonarius]KAF4587093.1 hypothetical protein EYR40_011114 [Pleurotus pulmonarius]
MIIPAPRSRKQPAAKSLTPKRKHWKTGSNGIEVWPEHIENTSVQGLREYKNSPFAVRSSERSRYRNQFLVEYLAKAGITRSNKQVASHIQVLRGMWSGTPDFQLVANATELPNLSCSVPTVDDHELRDPINTSQCRLDVRHEDSLSVSHRPPSYVVLSPPPLPEFDVIPSQLEFWYELLCGHTGIRTTLPSLRPPSPGGAYRASVPHSRNRVTALCLVASGVSPLVVDFDSILPPENLSGSFWFLETELSMIPLDLFAGEHEGFTGSVVLDAPFLSGTCITQVFSNQQLIHHESAPLYQSPVDPLAAILPTDSPLARCRSYMHEPFGATITLRQELIVDGETVLYAVHRLCRADSHAPPSARLVACRPYPGNIQKRATIVSLERPSQLASTAYRTTALATSTLDQHTAAHLTPSPISSATSSVDTPLTAPSATPSSVIFSYYPPPVPYVPPQTGTALGYCGSSLYDQPFPVPPNSGPVAAPDFYL